MKRIIRRILTGMTTQGWLQHSIQAANKKYGREKKREKKKPHKSKKRGKVVIVYSVALYARKIFVGGEKIAIANEVTIYARRKLIAIREPEYFGVRSEKKKNSYRLKNFQTRNKSSLIFRVLFIAGENQ